MKDRYPKLGLSRLCWLLGITRQAYYQHQWRAQAESIEEELVLQEVKQIRKNHCRMGGRKLFELLEPFMLEHQIKMGRDALFDLLAANHLLVRRKPRRIYTTQSFHWLHKYPNLIRDYIPKTPNQLWVSDITYLKTELGFLYISLITDAYSCKIVGYHIADNLSTIETIEALKMAIRSVKKPENQIIHHSDRGVQYCSEEYVKLLRQEKFIISMTESGDPLENAKAERINGIVKHEYMNHYPIRSLQQAKYYLEKAVKLYNGQRPHLSLEMQTPNNVHENNLNPVNLWKKKKTNIVNSIQD